VSPALPAKEQKQQCCGFPPMLILSAVATSEASYQPAVAGCCCRLREGLGLELAPVVTFEAATRDSPTVGVTLRE
jgi:hypothetical protein